MTKTRDLNPEKCSLQDIPNLNLENYNLSLEKNSNDQDEAEYSLRPKTLSDFIGQSALKENLEVFIQSAKSRKIAMDHVLFYGAPGLGKTTLSQIISHELNVGFKATSGPILSKAGDLAAILTNLQEKDVLFIDEIHRMNTAVEEILYPAMEDFQLDIMIGEGAVARSIRIDLPHFTLIGATTRSGMLTSSLRDRFGIPLRLEFYTMSELNTIIMKNANILGINISPDGANEIAKRSRGTPRIAIRLLKRIRDFAVVENNNNINYSISNIALKKLDIDDNGLDSMDRNYLQCILKYYNGGPVGVETLSAVLSEKKDTIEEIIEPYLLQKGLVQRTSRGRCLTIDGYRYLGVEPKDVVLLENDDEE